MYQTQWCRDVVPGTIFTIKSQVQSNEAFTVEELVKKFSVGGSLGIQHTPIFASESHDQADLQQIANMDLFDREQYSLEIAESKKLAELALKKHKEEEDNNFKAKKTKELQELAQQLKEIQNPVEPKA